MEYIRTFSEAGAALRQYYQIYAGQTKAVAYTLERVRDLLDYLGNPQNDLRMIHVAGTSGKTSTAYYASALLERFVGTVGLTVSPHIFEVNERLQINHVPLFEIEFCVSLSEFMRKVEISGIQPSYFEFMTTFAYFEFKRRKVDYAVIEVGLGGLLDATNVVSRSDKVCIITDIGLDHTNVLGKTLPEIAFQKAGIIQPHNQVFMYCQSDEVMDVIIKRCNDQHAELHIIDSKDVAKYPADSHVARLPSFQQRNYHLASQAIDFVRQRDDLVIFNNDRRFMAADIYIPGRMEVIQFYSKTIILDGAHNAQKMAALLHSLTQKYPNQKLSAQVGFMEASDNRWQDALHLVVNAAERVILTTIPFKSDMPKIAVPTKTMHDFTGRDMTSVNAVKILESSDISNGLQTLLDQPEDLLLITGSLYTIGIVKELLGRL